MIIANSVISSMADVRIEKNDATLEEFNLEGEQITTLTEDNIEINAYIVPQENSKGNVLILHGMHGMDATSLFGYAKFIYDIGYTPITVDMRAHGKSGGESLSFGYNEVYDVLAVIDYLKNDSRFAEESIILYGLSMGGSTAINAASKSEYVDGIIAVSPYLSIGSQTEDYMKKEGAPTAYITVFKSFVNLLLWQRYNVSPVKDSPAHTVRDLSNIPLLIIHGDQDTQTDVYHAKELFNNSGSNKSELWIVEGKDHLIVEDILNKDSKYYRDKIEKFLNDNFN